MNIGDIAARIRNIFQPAELVKRNDDGSVQIKTAYNRTVDNVTESFPYGFTAKSRKGSVTILCAGGNLDGVKILPVEDSENAPELEDGDVAVYSEGGAFVLLHADGKIEITNGEQSLNKLLLDLAEALINFKTFGSSCAQQTDPSSVKDLKEWQENWKQIFKE